ncbi:uncharacterized protein PHACADRAFT_167240 [Phanerochaete carnosa HHB-10118-sp]|uniref:Uncharacterized protein n=1 Tax=Phanerochaete carnosa (strain HHB-10118-sp) TaxID=650164 RepID=K5VS76_PHACS|nr:uncharacterized protein PHACADRAFT_167240 [Phanerochaete carnosa HHB-10118-sp]EKM49414.1 hypothetical protein PHACADRAFT_167240 [Phanerochaete carnosa HHB-10118-sp]
MQRGAQYHSRGQDSPEYGQAWHRYHFYSRVRKYDGLVAIVRFSTFIPELSTTIFHRYLVGNQHFVGNCRAVTTNWNATPLEGPFIVSRASDAE